MSEIKLFDFIEETLDKNKKSTKNNDGELLSSDFFKESLSEKAEENKVITVKSIDSTDVEITPNNETEHSEISYEKSESQTLAETEIPDISIIISKTKESNDSALNEKKEIVRENITDSNEDKKPDISTLISNKNEVLVTKSVTLEELKKSDRENKSKVYKRPTIEEIMDIKRAVPKKNYNIKTANIFLILVTALMFSMSI